MVAARRQVLGHVLAYTAGYAVLFAIMIARGVDLRANSVGWYVALAVMLLPTVTLLSWLTRKPRSAAETIAALVTNTAGLIGFFAFAHMQAGVAGEAGPIRFSHALYFSIVTWTTLGYGDIHPVPPLELLAAAEALIGYLYLSLLVAVLAKALRL